MTMIKVWSGAQRGGRRVQFPGPESLRQRRKVPTMSPVLFSIQNICFLKTSGSNTRALNLLLAPGAI